VPSHFKAFGIVRALAGLSLATYLQPSRYPVYSSQLSGLGANVHSEARYVNLIDHHSSHIEQLLTTLSHAHAKCLHETISKNLFGQIYSSLTMNWHKTCFVSNTMVQNFYLLKTIQLQACLQFDCKCMP